MGESIKPANKPHYRLHTASQYMAADAAEHAVTWWSGSARIATTSTGPHGASREVRLDQHAIMLALGARGSECEYRIDGSPGRTHKMRRGDFTFLPVGHQLHSEYTGTTQHFALLLDRNALQEDVHRSVFRMPFEVAPIVLGRADPSAARLLAALESECRNPGYADSLYCSHLAHALLVQLVLRQSPPIDTPAADPLTRFRIAQLHEYIEANLGSRLTIQELAAVIDVGPSHLSRLFKRATAVPLHQYVLSRRLAKARNLLLRSDAPLSQIALSTGFSSQSHLTSTFSRATGQSPSRFRQNRGIVR